MNRNTTTEQSKPVLVAVDLTSRSEACLGHGCDLAAKFGRPLVLLHVVHETAETMGMYRRYHNTCDTTPLRDIAHTMLEARIRDFRENGARLDQVCDVQTMVAEGLPETRILEVADRLDASMIVMCSHHRQGLSHLMHGSVTESVLRNASRPVVCLTPDESVHVKAHSLRSLEKAADAAAGA